MKEKCLATLLLVCLCFLSLPQTSCASSLTGFKPRERLHLWILLSEHPGELRLVRNVQLIFENTIGPPINTSLPAFNNGFIELEYALTPEVGKFFVTFNIFFDLNVDNETASSYADDIINEFFRVYNYQGLELLWKSQGIWESKIVVHKSFGYMPYTKEKVSTFLKFRPVEGFGMFIDSLLNKYVPGNATTGLSVSYWLKKTESFQWDLKVSCTTSSLFPWYPHNYSATIDVNELLNDDLSKVQFSQKQQVEISIETNKTLQLTKGLTTYTTTIESIQPAGYTISNHEYTPDFAQIKYEVPTMPNIIVKICIDSTVKNETFQLHPLLVTILLGVVTVFIVYLILRIFFPQYQGILRKKLKEE